MKNFKGFKITIIILLIILLSMVSFIGIYVQNKNQMENVLPEYILSNNLKGHRRIELKVNDEVKETKKYDESGNLITDDSTTEVAKTEEIKVNSDEVLTKENYEESKKVLEKRLEKMQVTNYVIRQNEENGNIIIELPENDDTDNVVGQVSLQGKFEIVDKDTNEVLMTNEDLKSVQSRYGTTSSGTTAIVLNIQFNKAGTEKFKNITNTYVQSTQTVGEGEEAKEETVTKQISVKIDDTTLTSTYFSEEINNGLLQLTVGSSTNSTAEELQEYAKEASRLAAVLDSGKMPIVYEVNQNKYVLSEVTNQNIAIVIVVSIIILTIGIVYIIIKYKSKGILAGISIIGYIALLLVVIRYANVEVSIAGIIEILFSTLINYMIVLSILKEEKLSDSMKKYALALIPALIISIAITFTNIAVGTVLFWGIAITLLYNLTITNLLLRD